MMLYSNPKKNLEARTIDIIERVGLSPAKQTADKYTHELSGGQSVGCPFAERCLQAMDKCFKKLPPVSQLGEDHFVRCYLYE